MGDESRPAVEKVHLPVLEGDGGVLWSVSPLGFHANLVALGPGHAVDRHRNDEVDVLVVVLDGEGRILIDEEQVDLCTGDAIVVPRGADRSIESDAGIRYLTVHARRMPLTVGPRRTTS